MRVPLAWLREYVDLPASAQEVADMLARIGFPVDSIVERPTVTGVLVGRIEELDKHPNADRLQVGKINVGNGALLTIATAATNVAQGQTIAVATIGAQLPQLKIERRKMRGVESEGMMISADELALPPDWFEDGIMQFDPDVPLGADVIEHFRLDDAVLDVDITSNRVDAMSMFGLARELAAFQGLHVKLPASRSSYSISGRSNAHVTIESPDCKHYVLQQFTHLRVGPSPAWMRIRLALAGQRPINNLVDVSNYVMLDTGQPLHFYDAAKIANEHLIVRNAREGEKLTTLDGVDHELTAEDLVIASEDGVQGFAGLMGGAASEVTESTTMILLEAATFTGSRVRRMSARHGFRSEASTRHEKALPTALALSGAARAAALLVGFGAEASQLVIAGKEDTPATITFALHDVKRLLGLDLPAQEIREYLDLLGFTIEPVDEHTLEITPPLWRSDISISADIVEEIARMAGYDRIEPRIPALSDHQVSSADFDLEQRIAKALCGLGYREIITYSLHGAQVLERMARAGTAPSLASVEVLNPLSEDQRFLRSALGPAHLEYLARIDRPMRVFEIGHIFYQQDDQPLEHAMVVFSFAAEQLDEPEWRDTHVLRLKGDVEALLHALTGARDFEFAADTRVGLHPGKTAAILLDGQEIGCIAQVDPRLSKAFDVRLPVYSCGLYLERIPDYVTPLYRPPSKYPSTYRDLALLCDIDVPAVRIERAIAKSLGALCTGVRAFDEYRGKQIAQDKKSLAVRVTLQKTDGTITDEEADAAIARALSALNDLHNITLRT